MLSHFTLLLFHPDIIATSRMQQLPRCSQSLGTMPSWEHVLRVDSERQAAPVSDNPSLLHQINRVVQARRAAAEGELSVGDALERHEEATAAAALTRRGQPVEEEWVEETSLHPSQPDDILHEDSMPNANNDVFDSEAASCRSFENSIAATTLRLSPNMGQRPDDCDMSLRHEAAALDLELAHNLLADHIQADEVEMSGGATSVCPSPSVVSQQVPGSPALSVEPSNRTAEQGQESPTAAEAFPDMTAHAALPDLANNAAAAKEPVSATPEEASPAFAMATSPDRANLEEPVPEDPPLDSRSPQVRRRPAAATAVLRRPAAAMKRPAAACNLEPGQRDARQHLEDGVWVGCPKCRWTACTYCRLRAQKAAQ